MDLIVGEGGYGKVILEVSDFEEYEFIKNFVIKISVVFDDYIKSMEVVKLKGGLYIVM